MLVAQVAVATGISPTSLLDCPPDVFRAIVKVLNDRNKQSRRA